MFDFWVLLPSVKPKSQCKPERRESDKLVLGIAHVWATKHPLKVAGQQDGGQEGTVWLQPSQQAVTVKAAAGTTKTCHPNSLETLEALLLWL